MKNTPVQNSNEGAADTANYTLGTYPKRTNTVTADVLANLLESKTLTGLDSVFKQNTTRLSAVIFTLSHTYGWQIERCDIATGTNDGRVATISAYWLSQATLTQAFEAGARKWIDGVRTARLERRKQAAQCKAEAAKSNASRRYFKQYNPRQGGFWGDNHV